MDLPPPARPDLHLIGVMEKQKARRRRRKPDLHYQAQMEREIYGRVVSESLRDLPPPNPFISVRR